MAQNGVVHGRVEATEAASRVKRRASRSQKHVLDSQGGMPPAQGAMMAARDSGLAPNGDLDPARILYLQRVFGNRHVAHQLATRRPNDRGPAATRVQAPTILRWDSPEHVALGDAPGAAATGLVTLDCHKADLPERSQPLDEWPEQWRRRYERGTADQRRVLSRGLTYGEIVALSGDFYDSYEALNRASLREVYDLIPLIRAGASTAELQEVTGGRYLALAEKNESHFSNVRPGHRNIDHWWRGHAAAIAAAKRGDANTAWVMNAVADHYLTDAFSGGHIRVKRKELMDQGTLGNIESKILHDLDNEHGVEVNNARNDGPWLAYGDDFLADPRNVLNKVFAQEAVALSKQDIADALAQGTAYPEPAKGTGFAAERLVPHAVDETVDRWTGRIPSYVLGPNGDPIRVPDDYTRTRDRVIVNEGPDVVAGLFSEDNDIRAWAAGQSLSAIGRQSASDRVRMIDVMLGGPTLDEDENSILRILRASALAGDAVLVVNRIGAHDMMSDFHGAEEEELRSWLRLNYYGNAGADVAYGLIVECIDGLTGEWEEEMIVDLLELQPDGRALIERIGRREGGWAWGDDADFRNGMSELKSQLDGADQDKLERLFESD